MQLQRKHNRSDTGTFGLQCLPLSISRLCELRTKFAYGISVSTISYSIEISLALKVKLEQGICPQYGVHNTLLPTTRRCVIVWIHLLVLNNIYDCESSVSIKKLSWTSTQTNTKYRNIRTRLIIPYFLLLILLIVNISKEHAVNTLRQSDAYMRR